MLNFDDLPYAENPGSVTITEAVVLTLASAAMTGTNWFGITHISPFIVVTPVVALVAIMILYRTVRNATHEAIRLADADAALDDHVMEMTQRAAKRTLTPMTLAASLEDAS